MQTIIWSERFSVGVKEIDMQHRGLLDIINQISDSIEQGNEWQTTSTILNSLINYAYNHFSTEERLMKEAEYSDLSWHVGLHLDFIKIITDFAQETSLKGAELQKEMLNYLIKWYTNHVLGIDRKYIDSLSSKGIK